NVLVVLDAGEHDGLPFMVSELLEGQTLRERLKRGPLPFSEALECAAGIASGLAAAHGKRILHRDLKPENVFITSERGAKILDFGTAKWVEVAPDAGEQLTVSGAAPGTVSYMSPEQVRGRALDLRSDLFSLGLVLHELFGGARAFRRESPVETAYAIISEPAPALPQAVPSRLRALVTRCLAKEREERPESAQQVADELALVRAEWLAQGPRKSRRASWVGLGAVLALAIAGVALRLGRTASPSVPLPEVMTPLAVLPARTPAATLAPVAAGLSSLLAEALQARGFATVPTEAVLRKFSPSAAADPARDAALATRLGAHAMLSGTLSETGGALSIALELRETASQRSLAQVTAQGPVEELPRIAVSLASQLRPALGTPSSPAPEGPLVLSEASSDVPGALRAYMEGEAALRQLDWRGATDRFRRAVALDPRFALAQYRLAVASAFREPGLSGDALTQALRYESLLSPRDRLLVDAFALLREGRVDECEAKYRELLRRDPSDVEAWYQLGELGFHLMPLHLRSPLAAAEAFGQVLSLDPEHGESLEHLADLALIDGDSARAAELAGRYLDANPSDAPEMFPMRWTRATEHHDTAERERILAALSGPEATRKALQDTFLRARWQPDDLTDALTLARAMTEQGTPSQRARGHEGAAIVELARGRPAAARQELRRASELDPVGPFRTEALWISTLDFLPLDRPQGLAALESAAQLLDEFKNDPQQAVIIRTWRGLLRVRMHDSAGAEADASELAKWTDGSSSTVGTDSALWVRASLAHARAADAQAQELLASMKLRVPYARVSRFERLSAPLLRARIAAASGRLDEALALTRVFTPTGLFEPVYLAPSLALRAEVLERKGDRVGAIAALRRLLALWSGAAPELAAVVGAHRAHLSDLERAAASGPPLRRSPAAR
ncbi:MAG: protein kinase, partial [Deltaproteobacteria bacterium]|nr:protein kinase [Deltaproteobacteria bacterium]